MNIKKRILCHSPKAKFNIAVLIESPLTLHPIPNRIEPVITLAFRLVCLFFLMEGLSFKLNLFLKRKNMGPTNIIPKVVYKKDGFQFSFQLKNSITVAGSKIFESIKPKGHSKE